LSKVNQFILNSYPQLKKWEVELLLSTYKTIVIEDLKVHGVALYIKINDEVLQDIESGRMDLTSPSNMAYCRCQDGDNIHFFLLAANGVKTILKGLREIIKTEHPKTVSWFSPDMKDFFIRRILCHQSL